MAHVSEAIKRFFRKLTYRRQKQPTAPIISPTAGQSLWDQAYDALGTENPGLVKDYEELLASEQMANSAPNETTPSLPALHGPDTRSDRSRRLATVIQIGLKRVEDNKTTFTIAGHKIVLKDQITTAAKFLLWGKEWIDTAVKASPEASLVWCGVCLVLPLLTNPTTADEANRDGFAYVTSRMDYYAALEPMLRRLGQNAGVDEALILEANRHLVHLYQAILDFQLSSVLRFYQSRLKTISQDIVISKNWEQTLLGIKAREQTVNNDFGQINGLAARQELQKLNTTSEDLRSNMESMLSVATEQLAVMKEQLAAQLAAQEGKLLTKQEKCLQAFWLTPSANSAAYDWYKDRVKARVEGTCEWFLQHTDFQEWLSQESGPLLVSADPGCGKSVLAKYLIDHELAKQSATICYFFFKDQDQNTIRQALCALLHQLFSHKEVLIQHAMKCFSNMGANLVQSDNSLWTILKDAVCDSRAGSIIFVIDALDECDESQLSLFITHLEMMFRDKQLADAKFKVLMTSRPYQQVVNKVYKSLQDSFPRIHIPGEEKIEEISKEINCVIRHRVEQLAKTYQLSDNIKSSLKDRLLDIEHRTYLWVYLVFDYLEKRFNRGFNTTRDGIEAAIQTLPQTVNQAYDQILSKSQDDESVDTVRKALSIILAARRPLTLSEMNIAMNLEGQSRGRSIYDLQLEQDVVFKSRLRALCGLFVNVHHGKLYFLHQTAREFLLQSSPPTTVSDLQWHQSIAIRHAHSVLAEICMLNLDRLDSTGTESFRLGDQHVALFQYSVEHWDYHYREAELGDGSAMVGLASGLFTPDLTSHSEWAHIISSRYPIRPESFITASTPRDALTPVTKLPDSRRADIEARYTDGTTALIYAARSGHEAITRLLLVDGADCEAKHGDGWTALLYAARSGYEAVTRLLLNNGADVEAKNNDGWTPLMYAARHGYEPVTRMLLENGADVTAKDEGGRTALVIAAEHGHEPVIQLLVKFRTNVEAKTNDGWTPLLYAARYGYEPVTRLLLENGANVEAKNNDGWTPLMYAAKSGDEAVTQLLLENGVNVEAKTNDGWTALLYAARFGHEPVTRLLLENSADIEAKDEGGRTALTFAAEFGHEPVTRLLLENGAKAKDNNGWTTLRHGTKKTRRLLPDHRARVEAKDVKG